MLGSGVLFIRAPYYAGDLNRDLNRDPNSEDCPCVAFRVLRFFKRGGLGFRV